MDELGRTVARLAHEHLGPLPKIDPAIRERARVLLASMPDDGSGTALARRKMHKHLLDHGIDLPPRVLRILRDDEIMRRMGEEQRHRQPITVTSVICSNPNCESGWHVADTRNQALRKVGKPCSFCLAGHYLARDRPLADTEGTE